MCALPNLYSAPEPLVPAGPLACPTDADVETAYRLHAPTLTRHALALTHDASIAEDVVQEAFVRLTRELRAGRAPDNVSAWLHRVVANLVTSRGRRLQVADRHAGELVERGSVESPEAIVLDGERRQALRAALATLSASDRRAVLLAAQGYEGPEIAALIGRSHGATRTLLCRARSRLRAEMLAAGAG